MAQGKGIYQRFVTTVPLPRDLRPLIDAEMEHLKNYSMASVMGRIVRHYFEGRIDIEGNPMLPKDSDNGSKQPAGEKSAESVGETGDPEGELPAEDSPTERKGEVYIG
tara:strand:- start:215 stop:538 length:324 start_codon:yes stop_codon:yes gene_type:complete